MTLPVHWLLQFGGTLGGGDTEIWSCGIKLAPYDDWDPTSGIDEEQYLEDTAYPRLAQWMQNPAAFISSSCGLTFCKFNEIGPDGRYKHPMDVHERFFSPINGQSGAAPHPYQVSAVYTWQTTEANKGPGSRGRIYAPMPTCTIDGATGFMNANSTNALATAARDLINSLDVSIGLAGGGVLRPSLVSQTATGDPIKRQIDVVSVDSRLDIQRRRANALEPTRVSLDVPY